MEGTLIRIAYLPNVTLGWMTFGDLRVATLEEAWSPDPDGPGGQKRESEKTESCIPDGRYKVVPHSGTRQKEVWALVNPQLGVYRWPGDIPIKQPFGRSAILINAGNDIDDIMGCIAVGSKHAILEGRYWVLESQKTLELLRAKLGRSEHELVIRSTVGTAELK